MPFAFPEFRGATRRLVLAWVLMIGGLVGFWCCRPWLAPKTFNYGQLVVLLYGGAARFSLSCEQESETREDLLYTESEHRYYQESVVSVNDQGPLGGVIRSGSPRRW